jgi:anti-sigma B factor antagonist
MPLKVDRNTLDSGVECIKLAGSLTLGRDAQNLEWSVEELIKNQKARIVFDLTEVSFVDSAGIGILVGCHGKATSAGGQLRIAGLADRVIHVVRVTKVDSILNIDPTFADSIRNIG